MSYLLSLLDKSPVAEGEGATEALARTVALARRAEHWGFHRFWVAEHHDTPRLASPSPEVLIAYLLAHTTRIRVGSGGVMLQHYSPYKVAENFNLLAALAPGRVDLGIGKAPGGLPLSTRALQAASDPARKPSFAEQLAQLDAFLDDTIADADPLAGVVATPRPTVKAERFLLGASVESAQLAAAEGWAFVHAGHLNGDPALLERVFAAYRARRRRQGAAARRRRDRGRDRGAGRAAGRGPAHVQGACRHRPERHRRQRRPGRGVRPPGRRHASTGSRRRRRA